MPLDNLSRRARASAAVSAVALALSILPAGALGADDSPVRQFPTLTHVVAERTAIAVSGALRARAARLLPVPPSDEVWDHVAPAEPASAAQVDPRQRIAARCPHLDDPNLLRDGAVLDGHGLCVRSVHQARTDVAAAAIVEGFGLLGLPYSRGRRGQDGYDDCSSFVGRAYREAGNPLSDSDWEPSSSVMRNASWAEHVDDPLPGDILWRSGHVAMALADGYQMHTSRHGDVTHVRSTGRYRRVLAVTPTL